MIQAVTETLKTLQGLKNYTLKTVCLSFILTILLVGCTDKEFKTKVQSAGHLNDMDILNKYSTFNTVHFKIDSISTSFYKDSLNNSSFSFLIKDFAYVNFYQFINHKWIKTDSLKLTTKFSKVDYIDLNYDSYKDIIIRTETRMPKKDQSTVYIYNTDIKRFINDSLYELPNVIYESPFIVSTVHNESGDGWEMNSYIVFYERIPFRSCKYYPNEKTGEFPVKIDLYEFDDKKPTLIRSDSGKHEEMKITGERWIKETRDSYMKWLKRDVIP